MIKRPSKDIMKAQSNQADSRTNKKIDLTWIIVWFRILTRPSVKTFEEIITLKVANKTTAYRFAVLGGLGVAVSILSYFEQPFLLNNTQGLRDNLFLFLVWVMVLDLYFIIGFLFYSLITQITARIMGGSGKFNMLIFAFSTFWVTVGVLTGFFSILGSSIILISIVIGILFTYSFILSVFATKVIHQLNWKKSITTNLMGTSITLLWGYYFAYKIAQLFW